jgi:hypothetical protein
MRDEIHYLLRPSVMETVAVLAGVGGGALWVRKLGKGKAAKAEAAKDEQSMSIEDKVSEALDTFRAQNAAQALPRSTQVIDFTNASQSVAKRV